MAGNKYQRYLNDEEASSRSSRLGEELKSVEKFAVGISAIIGVGAGARYLYKSGALDEPLGAIGGALNNAAVKGRDRALRNGASRSAFSKTVKEAGIWKTMTGGADDVFERNLRENLTLIYAKSSQPLAGESIQIEELIQKRGLVKAETMKSYIQGRRLGFIEEDLGNVVGKDSELFKDITGILHNDTGRKGLFDKANNEQLFQIFKKSKLDEKYSNEQLEGAAADLEKIMQKYRGKVGEWTNNPLPISELKTKASEFGKIVNADFAKILAPKNNARNRFLEKAGIKRATVEDALAHPEWFEGQQQYVSSKIKDVTEAKFVERNTYKKLQNLVKEDPTAIKLTLGKSIVMDTKANTLVDYRYVSDMAWKAFDFAADNLQVPLVNINPLRLAHAITIEGVRKAEPMAILRKGSKQLFLNGNTDDLANDMLYSGGKVYDIMSGKLVKDNVYLASSKYGMFKRVAENMGQLGNQKHGGWLKETLDIGLQERQSEWQRQSSFLTKFFDPTWEPNLIHGIRQQKAEFGEPSMNVVETAYKKIYDTLNRRVRVIDDSAMRHLIPSIQGKDFFQELTEEDILMNSNEQVMITLGKVLKMESDGSGIYSKATGLLSQLRGNANLYGKNKDVFEMIEQAVSDPELALPGILDSLQPSKTRMIDKYTDTKRLVQQEILSQLEAHQINYKGLLGELTDKQRESVDEINVLNRLRRMWKSVQGLNGDTLKEAEDNKKSVLSDWVGTLTEPKNNDKANVAALEKAVNKYNPWWGYGPGEKPNNALGDTPYIVMNKTRNLITSINEVMKDGGSIWDGVKTFAEDTVGQMGFGPKSIRAGRTNLDKVTTLTAGSYYYFDRLNEGIARAGLGLSQKSLGSAQDVFGNLLLRRFGVAALAVTGVNYLNYETENLTGIEPSDTLGKAYANMTMDVAWLRDTLNITSASKMLKRIMPGSEKLFQNPVGGAIKYGSFGLIGDERSEEELREYWAEGNDPIRKGRWWGIGSNTPWYGGKIDHYAPNWYRRIKSDYKYTDVLYGSKDEYWANSWMPTPSHPFAPIKRFLLDPNHWANKHKEDRPYPIYGGYGELDAIPLIGPVLNGTIGQILNPERRRGDLSKAHRQYLRDINESIKSQGENHTGGYLYITPAGGMQIMSLGSGEGPWGNGAGISYAQAPTESGGIAVVDPRNGFSTMRSGSAISGMEISAINQGYVSRSAMAPSSGGNLDSFRDKEFVENLDEAIDPRSAAYRFGETFYSITELGGIYGFALTSFTGDGASKRPVMARAMDMNSPSRMFWEMQLGGAGGDLSEIGRRFIPKRRREEQYNPYRNTQPSWMPGPEYMLDFRHGDPYAKITGGEYRLPGAGYESLNKLHPDMFGEYGALDRFKILADVAPYSDQYKYYKRVLSTYNQMGWLSSGEKKDIETIKDQTREAKKKYEFTPYKFKYANIDTQYVTIEHMVDDVTFVAKEFPGHPIRLAGIDMPAQSDTSEAAQAARAYLQQQLKPGKRVKIGVDSDELFKVTDDTMQTMRAVVYDSTGHSMSAKLARSKTGAFMGLFGGSNAVDAKWDDTSATTVNALYTKGEITLGKAWELFSHLDTPIHTKLLQNRSPLEQYKRRELYGKNWQSWDHPIRDWVKPTINKMTQANPIIATGVGAAIGSLFSSGSGKKVTATIGAVVAGVSSTLRVANEAAGRVVNNEYTWIPKVRRRERAIDEYFDILEYMKYKGLYEKTRKLAIRREGVDVEKLTNISKSGGRRVQAMRRALENKKRWIKINMSDPSVDQEKAQRQLDEINDQLNEFSAQKGLVKLGPLTLQAMKYKGGYESTLYGANPNGGMVEIYRALPKKDREFFKEFILAAPEEREEILRLVPKNQRRFYQAKWGLEVDKQTSLNKYFTSHYLPDASWAGWKPDVSLEAIKLKVVQNEALDMGEFGFFAGDERRAASAPNIKPFRPSGFLNSGRLQQVLRGIGLTNVDIKEVVTPGEEHGFNINVNLNRDRRKDITDIMNSDIMPMIST
jgi:hypothetical protein